MDALELCAACGCSKYEHARSQFQCLHHPSSCKHYKPSRANTAQKGDRVVRDTVRTTEDLQQLLAENAEGLRRARKYGQRKLESVLIEEHNKLEHELEVRGVVVKDNTHRNSREHPQKETPEMTTKKNVQSKATVAKSTKLSKTPKWIARMAQTPKRTVEVPTHKGYTIREASEYLHVNPGRIGWLTRKAGGKRLEATKVGHFVVITKASVEAYRKERDARKARNNGKG